MARVRSCELLGEIDPGSVTVPCKHTQELTLLLRDERNALERVLLHFSHFEKETRKLDDRLYEIRLRYDRDDESELLIRVLSFGPVLEVTAPAAFRQLMQQRLQRQRQYRTSEHTARGNIKPDNNGEQNMGGCGFYEEPHPPCPFFGTLSLV